MKIDASKSAHPFPPKHILTPLDFSYPCLYGLAAALDLTQRFNAKLTVVHVTRHMPPGARVMTGTEDDSRKTGIILPANRSLILWQGMSPTTSRFNT